MNGNPVDKANACLIAAAPELLEALQAVLRSFPTDRDMRDAGWERAEIDLACRDYEAARAAISKALPNAAAKEAGTAPHRENARPLPL